MRRSHGNLPGAILLICGVWALLRWEPLRAFRLLGPVLPLLVVAFVITNGWPYYAAGCYAAVIAAGAVWWTSRAARWRPVVMTGLTLVSAVIVMWSLPWQPGSQIKSVDSEQDAGLELTVYGKFGWPELRDATAAAYRSLPVADRDRTVVITDSYWQASALDVERGKYGLPPVYSPSRGFGYFGTPPDSATTVLWTGGDEADLRRRFASVTAAGRADARLGFPGVSRNVTIWRCDGPREPWSRAWPTMLRLG